MAPAGRGVRGLVGRVGREKLVGRVAAREGADQGVVGDAAEEREEQEEKGRDQGFVQSGWRGV